MTRRTWPEVLELARRANPHYSMTEDQQEMLWRVGMASVPEGGLIVELGVCWGKTAVVLAGVAEEKEASYVGIDNWSLEGSITEVRALLEPIGGAVRVVEGRTQDVDDYLSADEAVDLLIIDAGHDEENIREDCKAWIPRVAVGGHVAFHDYPTGRGWETSCHEAVRRNADLWTGDWPLIAAWDGLIVRRRVE